MDIGRWGRSIWSCNWQWTSTFFPKNAQFPSLRFRGALGRSPKGFNQLLIDQLKTIWEKDKKAKRGGEYINLADPNLKDPVLLDAWKIIPAETKIYAYSVFGSNSFPVRKDMIDNAVGRREASVG